MKFTLTILSILVLALTVACEREQPAPATTPAPMAGQPGTPPHPMGGMQTGGPAAVGITYELPAGWNRVQPESSMRIDQATIPGAAGSADMAVFFFGVGSGGGTQANLDRWAAQVESTAAPKQESFESNGMKITWMDVSGTLKPSSMGMGPATDQPNSRMFAAVVEGEGGPWFFKITGPEQTLADQQDEFMTLLRSVKTAGRNV